MSDSQNDTEREQAEHRSKMQQVKETVAANVAAADEDKGLLIVLTGDGNGKSSSGFGMVLRALGHGMPVGVVQFIKGKWQTGEQKFFERTPEIRYFAMGQGFTWDTQDREGDIARARECWSQATALLNNSEVKLLLLDELNVVLSFEYLPAAEVLAALQARPAGTHVVVTGRGAPPELIEIADTVSRIEVVKHAFDSGIRAQRGTEF